MATITERVQMNRVFADDWSVFEKLILASAVQKSGDQNWGSVTKKITNFFKADENLVEIKRPADWFTPKACAIQYQLLLENYANDLPRRKKRDKNSVETTETPVDYIVRQLWQLRKEEIYRARENILKENEEITNLLKEVMMRNKSDPDLEQILEKLKNNEINKEKQQIVDYEEIIRKREEKKKIIESNKPVALSSVNTSLYKSALDSGDDKCPTSPLLTSLLQSPSRSATPTLTTPTLSKLLESPSNLLQKELSKQQQSSPIIVVPPPDPSPNSLAVLDDIKAEIPDMGIPEGELGVNDKEVEEFADKWFDADFLNMGKEELEGTLNAKALLEVLGGSEEVVLSGRSDSIEDPGAEEIIALDLDTIPAESVDDEVILTEVLASTGGTSSNSTPVMSQLKQEEDVKVEVKEEQPQQEEAVVEKNVNATRNTNTPTLVTPKEEDVVEVKDKAISKDAVQISKVTTPVMVVVERAEEPKIKESDVEKKEVTKEQVTPVKETRSSRSSRDSEGKKEVEASPSLETRERRKSKVVEDNKSPVKDKRMEVEAVCSPLKETRSSRHRDQDNKETRSLRSRESDSRSREPESSPKEMESPMKETRSSKNKDKEDNAKESPVKETRGKDTRRSSVKEETPKKDKKEDVSGSEKRKLRSSESESDPKFPSMHYDSSLEDSNDSLEESVHSEMVQRMEQEMFFALEFKTPTPAATTPAPVGRKRKESPVTSASAPPDSRTKRTLIAVYQNIISNKHASVFMKPVLDAQARNYSKVIKMPTNLSSIKKKIESGAIRSVSQFQRALLLLVTNAMMYNPQGSPLYNLAREMLKDINPEILMLVQAVNEEGQIFDLNQTDDEMSTPAANAPSTERLKRQSTKASDPIKAKEEKKESEEDGGRRSMKRPLAPSPKTVLMKKRKTK